MRLYVIFSSVAVLIIIAACSSNQCNNLPQRPEPSPTPSPSQSLYKVVNPEAGKEQPRLPSVNVSKGTGELQCGTGKAIPIEDMQHTLVLAKVTVYEARTQLDGLMHVALCGSPTGKIHVFTIPQADLKKALKLGFKVLKDPEESGRENGKKNHVR
jgi:hypothetical protein